MDTGAVLLGIGLLVILGCNQPHAGPQSAGQPTPTTSSAASSHEGTTQGQITPDTGQLPPHPEVSLEERERLLRGTEREDPQGVENDPPSPPGLPLVPGPETKVAPSPHEPR